MIHPKKLRNLQKKSPKFRWGPKLGTFTVHIWFFDDNESMGYSLSVYFHPFSVTENSHREIHYLMTIGNVFSSFLSFVLFFFRRQTIRLRYSIFFADFVLDVFPRLRRNSKWGKDVGTCYSLLVNFFFWFFFFPKCISNCLLYFLRSRPSKVAVRLLGEKHFPMNRSVPLGPCQLQKRHLEILGYRVVDIDSRVWNSMSMCEPGRKIEFLRRALAQQQGGDVTS